MVRLHISVLALTFATGLVLASSDYQRRDDELFERDNGENLDNYFEGYYDLLQRRSDTFDEPEARGLFGSLLKVGEEVGEKSIKGRVGMVMKGAKIAEKLEKHGNSAKKIEKRLKPSKKIIAKRLNRAAKKVNKNNNDNQNKGNQNRANQDLQRAMQEVADANRYLPANRQYHVQSRRDLDADDLD